MVQIAPKKESRKRKSGIAERKWNEQAKAIRREVNEKSAIVC